MNADSFPTLYPTFAFIFAAFGTYIALELLKSRVLDVPNERSNHQKPVPRGGGIAMILVSLIFMAATGMPVCAVAAAGLLAGISFIDDLRGLPAWLRLFVQILAVGLGLHVLPPIPVLAFLPASVAYVFLGLVWLWIINLTNFMDGIDGISAVQAMCVTAGICLLRLVHPALPLVLSEQASILAAAALGFFLFNRPPAKLFMGDVGSVPLGFLTGYLLLQLAAQGLWVAAFILPAYYLCDATFTLLKRGFAREKIWQAHSQHAYQCAVRGGQSHGRVVWRIFRLNVMLVALAMLASLPMMTGEWFLLPAYFLTFCLIQRFRHAPAHR